MEDVTRIKSNEAIIINLPEDIQENLTARQRCSRFWSDHWKGVAIVIVPIIFAPLLLGTPVKAFRCAYCIIVMICFWITEAISIYVTALIPILAFPLLGIMSSNEVCTAYVKDGVIFFFGAILLAIIVEDSKLLERIAMNIFLLVGSSPRKLHFAMSFITMLISMWIANVVVTAMMCPIIRSILLEIEKQKLLQLEKPNAAGANPDKPARVTNVVLCFYFGIAYASSIGGLGTIIGSGTNFVLLGIYHFRFPQNSNPVEFVHFMLFNAPPMFILTVLVCVWLQFMYMGLFRPNSADAKAMAVVDAGKEAINEAMRLKKKEMGPITILEIQIAILCIALTILCIMHKPGFIDGWGNFLKDKEMKTSAVTASIALLCFLLASNYYWFKYCVCKKPDKEGTAPSLAKWRLIQVKFPWGLLFLFGSGFALSEGIMVSGLGEITGLQLEGMKNLSMPLLVLISLLVCILTTNFITNMTALNILAPVIIEMALHARVHPLYLLMPASVACSLAFHLPIGTPSNRIIRDYANITVFEMVVAGIAPTIMGISIYWVCAVFYAPIIWPEISAFPDWAK